MKCAPHLSHRLKTALDALELAGIKPDTNELVWLSQLADKADRPIAHGVPWVAGHPIKHCGTFYYPLTRRSQHWFVLWHPHLKGDENAQVWMFGFVHAFSAIGDKTLEDLTEINDIKTAIDEWSKSLDMPLAQINPLYDKLQQLDGQETSVQSPEAKKQDDQVMNMNADTVALCKAFPGTTPTYWQEGISVVESNEIISSLGKFNGAPESSGSPKNEAINNFRNAVKCVRKWHGIG